MTKLIYKSAMLALFAHAVCGCRGPAYNLPPMQHLKAPGPGVDGPGPGVLSMSSPGTYDPYGGDEGGEMLAGYEAPFGACGGPSIQLMFAKPNGMHVTWDTSGTGSFDSTPLVAPGRTNFNQVGLYRLKLTNIPAHEGTELYPTVEIAPATPRTHAFLAHNTVPIQFTVDDFNQITAGNYVTKVIYLPDPGHQHLAVAGVETLVSTRLDPGVDPIVEADRRGTILAVVRAGNKDIEMPGMENEASLGYMGTLGTPGPSCAPTGFGPMGGGGPPTGLIAGVNMPMYGAPITGTPIGLPGPPHHAIGRSCRFAEARDSQSHAPVHSQSISQSQYSRQAESRSQLSGSKNASLHSAVQPSAMLALQGRRLCALQTRSITAPVNGIRWSWNRVGWEAITGKERDDVCIAPQSV